MARGRPPAYPHPGRQIDHPANIIEFKLILRNRNIGKSTSRFGASSGVGRTGDPSPVKRGEHSARLCEAIAYLLARTCNRFRIIDVDASSKTIARDTAAYDGAMGGFNREATEGAPSGVQSSHQVAGPAFPYRYVE